MTQTIVRAFKRFEDANLAVAHLEALGVKSDAITILASDIDGRYIRQGRADNEKGVDDAVAGAEAGAGVGGAVGLAAGLGLLVIPGVGQVVAAGWLAAAAAGALAGAAVGGATGRIVGALTHHGLSEPDARAYSDAVRRGDALVSVRANDAEVAKVKAALDQGGGIDATATREAHQKARHHAASHPASHQGGAARAIADSTRF